MDVIFSKIWEIGGTAGISLAILWVIVRGIKKQQERDTDKLDKALTDIAVIKTQILSALTVAQDVKEHDRTLVSHGERIKKNTDDINAQHARISEAKEDIKTFLIRYESKH